MAFPFAQLLANSLIIGAVYALVAAGFSLIYSTSRFMHFAHGVAVAAGGYSAYVFLSLLGLPFFLGLVGAILVAAILGWLMHRLIYVPMKGRNASSVILLLASVALLILVENLLLLLFGAQVKTFTIPSSRTVIEILGARVTVLHVVIITTALVLMLALWFLMARTSIGRKLRAVADNPELARIMGLDANRLTTISFIIGSALAGVAGVLIGAEQNLTPTMGTSLMIKGFTGAVIGGITSVPAAIVGSLLVGVVENFGVWWLPSGFKDAITFSLLFVFLIVRPNGLFGVSTGVRK